MIKLYVMEGGYVNTLAELHQDYSDHGVSGVYEVNISEYDYINNLKHTVDNIIIDNCCFNKPMPPGYIKE